MSTVKVNAIRSTSGSSDAITLNSSSGVTAINGNSLRVQNLVVNGSMAVAQRGTSSPSSGIQTVDGFSVNFSGTDQAPTQDQVALTSSDTGPWEKGFRYAFQLTNGNQTTVGAADYIYIENRIEAQNMAQSGWDYTSASSYVTLSFWVKASVAQNYYGYLRSSDGTGQIYTFETGALTADTWTKITKKIPGHANLQFDNNNEQGFKLFLTPFFGTDNTGSTSLNTWGAYGSGATRVPDMTSTWYTTNDSTFSFTGVQLEVGDTATEFEHRSYADELARCQRYFFNIKGDDNDSAGVLGHALSANEIRVKIDFPVPMRQMPVYTGTATDAKFKANNTSSALHWSYLSMINPATTLNPSSSMMKFDKGSSLSITAGECGDMEFHENGGELQFSAEI